VKLPIPVSACGPAVELEGAGPEAGPGTGPVGGKPEHREILSLPIISNHRRCHCRHHFCESSRRSRSCRLLRPSVSLPDRLRRTPTAGAEIPGAAAGAQVRQAASRLRAESRASGSTSPLPHPSQRGDGIPDGSRERDGVVTRQGTGRRADEAQRRPRAAPLRRADPGRVLLQLLHRQRSL
jgi:hypothetical protein